MFFSSLRGAAKPTDTEASDAIYRLLTDKACLEHTRDAILNSDQHAWELAYALAWISLSEDNSVMPPWVRHQFPDAGQLVRRLRDTPCDDCNCNWCGEWHDARKELTRWFGFDDFRQEPDDDVGRSIQQSIVEAAMARKHVLGILPTGAGKSALLSTAGAIALRQDRCPDGGNLAAGRPHGRPSSRA